MKQLSNRGFTLVELVIGIVVLAITMVSINTLLLSQGRDVVEPLYRFRSAQLAQGVIEGLLQRDYDDIDDFATETFISAVNADAVQEVFAESLPEQYSNYALKITISSDTIKQIDVTIKTPSDQQIVFSALKGNY